MYLPQRSLNKRGASVLAALVLVAILGAVFIVFQYARSSGDFAYDSAALTAATAASATAAPATPASSTQPPPAAGCTTIAAGQPNAGKTTCPCGQAEANSALTGATTGKEGIEQCLPGCEYRITPGNPPVITAVSPNSYSDPSQASCKTDVCTNPNNCSSVTDSNLNSSLTSQATALTAVSITNAGTPILAAQITSTYGSNSGDLSELSTDLSTISNQNSSNTGITETADAQSNINAANAQITALSTTPDTGVPCSGTSFTISGPCGQNVPLAVNPGTDGNIATPQPGAGPATPANTDVTSITPTQVCSVPGDVSINGSCQTPPATIPKTTSCSGAQCNGGGPGNTFSQNPPAAPAPGGGAPVGQSPLGGSSGGSPLTAFLTGLVQGVSKGLAQQNAAAAAQQAYSPYGVGTDGLSCPQPQPEPDPSQCSGGNWKQIVQQNQCPTTWQCVPTTASAPIPQLSCEPQVGDVGTTVSLSYSCGNSTGSSGSGFTTGNQLSGSTSTVLETPPAGDNTASFGLTCINQTVTAGAQCSIQVNTPSIVLIANPSAVATGGSTAIGWVTSGMQSCVVSSPTNASFTAANVGDTSVNGLAITAALAAPMTVVLNCETQGGGTKSASTSITVGGVAPLDATSGTSGTPSTSNPVTVSSSADGGTIAHGSSVQITWSTASPLSGSSMALVLVNKQTGAASDVIVGGLSTSGTYTWNVPAVGAACNPNASNVCDTDLVQGNSYAIEAVSYTPENAYVGDGTEPSSPVAPTYGASAVSGNFTINDSQQGGGE